LRLDDPPLTVRTPDRSASSIAEDAGLAFSAELSEASTFTSSLEK
jgi:hypothetical protein